jgi:hypothetical protein
MTVALPSEQRGGRLIGWVLRHQATFKGSFQDRLAERPRLTLRQLESSLLKVKRPEEVGYDRNNAVLFKSRRNGHGRTSNVF